MPESVKHLTDFPDRYSPMLVKELRQGMRAKTFIAVFLSLQMFLAVMLFSAAANMSTGEVGSVISTLIFTFFAIAVLLVQPLRGTGALSSEVKGNTIDMMVLTRLSAWRIVFGKWVAIVGQTALLFVTIIPYLILRYFFGGMDLIGEMVFLLLLFVTSMALTAVTVGLSGCNSVIIRSLVPILSLPAGLWGLLMLMLETSFFRGGVFEMFSLTSPESRWGVAAYLACIAYNGWSMLSMGASLIAPAAENHALPRRLVALVLLAIVAVMGLFRWIEPELILLFTFIVASPAIILALNDSSPLIRTVCEPFQRRGALGSLLGNFLYPTWWSGVFYTILFSLIALGVMMISVIDFPFLESFHHSNPYGAHWDAELGIVIFSILGSFLFPALWQMIFFKGEGQRIANYLLVYVGAGLFCGVLAILADSMNSEGFVWIFAFSPLNFLVILENGNHSDRSLILAAAIIVDALIAATLFVAAMRDRRKATMNHLHEDEAATAQIP